MTDSQMDELNKIIHRNAGKLGKMTYTNADKIRDFAYKVANESYAEGVKDTSRPLLNNVNPCIANINYTAEEAIKARKVLRAGDRIKVSDFTVPEYDAGTMHFDELKVLGACLEIVNVNDERAIAMFDHVIFNSAIDKDDSVANIYHSQLFEYLNGPFLQSMKNAGFENLKEKDIGLISRYEMFGDGPSFSMFDKEPLHFEYFNNGRNRIRFDSDEDCSRWYWLANQNEEASLFAGVDNYGRAVWGCAGNSNGVSPALRIA
jgi:hypothetical protein